MQYLLTYEGTAGAVTQAHFHFAGANVNGAIADELLGENALDQTAVDYAMIELDGDRDTTPFGKLDRVSDQIQQDLS